jgi:imidazolonepropionase-like amidohydrolase
MSLTSRVVLRGGTALTGASLEQTPFEALVLQGDTIEEILTEPRETRSDAVVDVAGGFVVPGLIDAHVHFDLAAQAAAYTRWSDPRAGFVRSLTCVHNGLLALSRGITSVRDLGSVDSVVLDYADHVDRGVLTGPRVRAAGKPITITGGHCAQYGRTASGPLDVREAVREQVEMGAHVIKIMASGGISTPGDPSIPQFTVDEMHAAVDEAHRFGRQVAAHAHAARAIALAIEAGVDTIEHAGFADAEALELLVRHDRTLVPTVSALNEIMDGVGIPAQTVIKSLAARETYRRNTGLAITAGVRIAAGTDAGTAFNPIGGLVDELEMYCERGMTAELALRAATVHAGPLIDSNVGRIEPGFRADLLVVPEDPRADISVLRRPSAVISRGRVLSISSLEDSVAELAAAVAA